MANRNNSNHKKDSKPVTKKSLEEQIKSLKHSNKQLASKNAKLSLKNSVAENKILRALANTQNTRKRARRNEAMTAKYGAQDLAKALFPHIDNLERALATPAHSQDAKSIKIGVKMVLQGLLKALKQNHITVIHTLNKPYDPHVAQAVKIVKSNQSRSGEYVVKVLRIGYKLYDRILRPATVVVAK